MRKLRTKFGTSQPESRKLIDRLAARCWPLNADQLGYEARRQTGVEDFGQPPLEPGLSALTTSLHHEADLHPLGRFLMRSHLKGLLSARLRLTEQWRQASAPGPIQGPLFITGMPRSGSTFLHELLAQDPALRVPRVWEVMFPLRPPGRGRDPRMRQTAACLWWFRRIAPRADSVHPMRAETPQECVALQSYTFLSYEFVSTCRVRSYEAFLRSTDLTPVYIWQRRFLQHLQEDAPPARWVLKSPDHGYSLDALFAAFPDARIVQTHRNPADVLRSSIQLLEVLHDVFARPSDRQALGLRETRLLAEAMECFIKFREDRAALADRFLDVSYQELVAEPLASVRRIYRHMDMPLSPAAADAMSRLIAHRSRYRKRSHAPTLADLGIDARAAASRFKRYCSCFGIPWHTAEAG